MARLRDKIFKKKIKGSTLIEVLVAMVIVLVVYSIAMMIFLNIKRSANTGLKSIALLELDNVVIETKKKFSFIDEDYKTESFVIKKKISPYGKNNDLRVLSVEVVDLAGRLITERKEIVKLNR